MNYGYMVVYKKNNGNLLYRAVKNKPGYNKGEYTSMGWYVLDIQRLYNGKCYSTFDFNMKLEHKHKLYDILILFNKTTLFDTLKLVILFMTFLYIFVKFI